MNEDYTRNILTKTERKEIIEELANKYYKKGLICMKNTEDFISGYTDIYQFTIKDPTKFFPFISIIELINDERYEKKSEEELITTGIRTRFLGDYEGLHTLIKYNHKKIKNNNNSHETIVLRKSISNPNPEIEKYIGEIEAFDNALQYIRDSIINNLPIK